MSTSKTERAAMFAALLAGAAVSFAVAIDVNTTQEEGETPLLLTAAGPR